MNAHLQIANTLRVIPFTNSDPNEQFYLVVNIANRRWLKITKEAHDFLLDCGSGQPLEQTIADAAQRFEVAPGDLKELHDQFVKQGFLVTKASVASEIHGDGCIDAIGEGVVYFNVTGRCNLQCTTCYFNASPSYHDPLGTEEMKQVINNLAAGGVTQVVVSGGEPLVRQDIFDLLQHARSLFRRIILLTNGIILRKYEICQRLAGLVDRVQVSLDGGTPEVHEKIRGKGTFIPTIEAIKNLKRVGLFVNISMTLTRINIDNVVKVMALAEELEVPFDFSRFLPVGRGLDNQARLTLDAQRLLDAFRQVQERALETNRGHLNPFYRQLGLPVRVKCGAGQTTFFSVAPDGSVYPCHVLHHREFYMGNALKEQNLRATIERSPVAQRFRALDVDARSGCKDCPVRYFCGGGCFASSWATWGEINKRDPFCPFYRKFEEALLTGWRYDLPPQTNVKRVVERLR